MALNPKVTAARRKAQLDTMTAAAASGILRVYSGAQPTDADTAVGAQVVLAELTMNATAFNAPAAVSSTNYVLTANAITSDSNANATGTAAWFRLWDSAGTTALMDGTVGTSGCDLTIASTSIVATTTVSATSMTLTMAA
jgi:hypothetical protein